MAEPLYGALEALVMGLGPVASRAKSLKVCTVIASPVMERNTVIVSPGTWHSATVGRRPLALARDSALVFVSTFIYVLLNTCVVLSNRKGF